MSAILDCPTTNLVLPDGVRDMWLVRDDVLVVNTFRALTFLDVSKPREARVMHQRKTRFDRTVRTRLTGNFLACAADDGVEVLDVSDPEHPREARAIACGETGAACVVDGKVWILGGNGIAELGDDGALTPVADAGVAVDRGNGGDLVVDDDYAAIATYDAGVCVWKRGGGALVAHGGVSRSAYHLACKLAFHGGQLFDLGETDALVRFALDGNKAKKLKATKVAGVSLAPQAVDVGDGALLLAGLKEKDQLVLAVVDKDGAIASKETLPGFRSRDTCSDSMRGLVRVRDTLIVASYARRLYAVSFPS